MGSNTDWEFLWETEVLWGTEAVFVTPEYKNFEEATRAYEARKELHNEQ